MTHELHQVPSQFLKRFEINPKHIQRMNYHSASLRQKYRNQHQISPNPPPPPVRASSRMKAAAVNPVGMRGPDGRRCLGLLFCCWETAAAPSPGSCSALWCGSGDEPRPQGSFVTSLHVVSLNEGRWQRRCKAWRLTSDGQPRRGKGGGRRRWQVGQVLLC